MDFTVRIVSQNLKPQSNFIEFRDYRNFTFFEKKLQNRGMSVHVALGGRELGLPRGTLHEKQLLAGCMKATLLAAIRETGWGE